MTAHDHRYRIVLSGKAESPPAQVQVPTLEGLRWDCWDTTHGRLQLEVWARSRAGSEPETLILQACTNLAGLEVGGQGWHQDWRFTQA